MAHGLKGKTLLAYVAGLVDGEGNIGLHKSVSNSSVSYYTVHVGIGNTNEWLIQFLKMNFGGSICLGTQQNENAKPIWRWEIRAKKAFEFLNMIIPYLQIKYPQAELAIKFQNRRHKGAAITPEAKLLNETDRILMSNYNKRGKLEE